MDEIKQFVAAALARPHLDEPFPRWFAQVNFSSTAIEIAISNRELIRSDENFIALLSRICAAAGNPVSEAKVRARFADMLEEHNPMSEGRVIFTPLVIGVKNETSQDALSVASGCVMKVPVEVKPLPEQSHA